MADIFLSYTERSHIDKAIADKVNMALTNSKLDVWFAPERIPGGANYKEYVTPAVKDSKILILIASEASLLSQEVQIEINTAYDSKTRIIPLLIPSLDQTMYREIVNNNNLLYHSLSTVQYIDMAQDNIETSIKKLCDSALSYISGTDFKSMHSHISEESHIEKIRNFLFNGDFYNARQELNASTAYVKDKAFFNLASIICDLSTSDIHNISSSKHNHYIEQLQTIALNEQYKNVSLYIIFSILICCFDKWSLASYVGTAKSFANKIGEEPFVCFDDKKIIRHLKLCENFDKKYSYLF